MNPPILSGAVPLMVDVRQTGGSPVVHTALDALERQEFMRGLNADYQSLDAAAREDLLAEQAEWDPLV